MPTRTNAATTKAAAKPAPKKKSAKVQETVTSKQLAISLAEEFNFRKIDAVAFADKLFGTVRARLADGDKVRILGLGIFVVKDRPARQGRNPATGETVQIAASRKISYRAARDLKDAVAL